MTKAVMNRLGAAAMLALLGVSGGALAAPSCPETNDPQANYRCIFIDRGVSSFGDGKTGGFYELGLTGTLATSIYQAGLGLGSTVIDTNRKSVINSFGFASGNFNNVTNTGPQVGISDTATFGQRNVDSLNPLAQPFDDLEGFNVGGGFGLSFDYQFNGTLTAGGPVFSSGDIIFTYTNFLTNASETVLRINISGSSLQAANLDLFGTVSFDFNNDNIANDCTRTLCQAFWNFQTGPENWYNINGQGVAIAFALDTNVNPPFPAATQLTAGANASNAYWARQSTLDSSIRFNEISEPGSLALAGLALIGLAGVGARRSRKA